MIINPEQTPVTTMCISTTKKISENENTAIFTKEELDTIRELDEKLDHVKHRKSRITRYATSNFIFIINNLVCEDTQLIREAKKLCQNKIVSETSKQFNHVVRILFESSYLLGRPYDVNMLALLLGSSISDIIEALKKNYKGFVNTSNLKISDFFITYLWILGLNCEPHISNVEKFIKYVNRYDGRSIYAIARDFVIIYFLNYLELSFKSINNIFIPCLEKFENRSIVEKKYLIEKYKCKIKDLIDMS